MNLLLGVHHERTVPDDGLVDGFAAEQQHLGVVVGLQGQLLTVALEQGQLPLACDFFAIDQQRAAEHHQGGVTPGVQVQRDRFTGVEAQVPYVYRREGAGRALSTGKFPGDQAQVAGVVCQWQHRNVAIDDGLVTGIRHFVLGRQVDPQLHHLQCAATTSEVLGVKLFVQDPFGCGHPLHIARADFAAGTGRIAVLDFAVVDDGHGFKTAMRVLADAATLFSRGEFGWTCVIQQQEWADVLAHGVVGKQRAYRKAVADPVGAGAGVDTNQLFHGVPPK